MAQPSKIALRIATEAKSIGDTNLTDTIVDCGFHVAYGDSCNGISDAAFDALIDEVEAAMPFARYDRQIARDWARAGADIHASERHERMAFALD